MIKSIILLGNLESINILPTKLESNQLMLGVTNLTRMTLSCLEPIGQLSIITLCHLMTHFSMN